MSQQWLRIDHRTVSIREITLQRAERRNALSIELLDQLLAALHSLAAEPAVRVVILRGDGPVFSAGLDLKEAGDDALIERSADTLDRTLRLLHDSPLISIAAVHGGAYAGGAGVMAACDLVVAADDAKFGFPEAQRGLLPALISRVLRPKIRDGDLRDLFLVGEAITAARAQQIGLIQHVVPGGELLTIARRLAHAICAGGPETIRMTKHLLNDLFAASSQSTDDSLEELHLKARRSAEAREGLAAFQEKRPPVWTQEKTP